jgi:hypothetical protein
MSLFERWRGCELSVLEKELIFNKDNTGFVRYDTKDGKYFFLHPSPFLNSPKNEIFFAESCQPPAEHTFVEVEVASENHVLVEKDEAVTVKSISSWKPFDPGPLAERRKIMDYEEVIYHFTHLYRGEEDTLHQVATCSALYALSSPPLVNTVGGINAAVLGKKHQWDLFKESMSVIPRDFLKPNFPYYYYISDRERPKVSDQTEEINLAILKPERYVMDIPLVIEDTTPNRLAKADRELIDEGEMLVTSYLLDALLIKPDPGTVEKTITDAVYTLREEFKRAGYSVYKQNLGDAVPKLSSSIARLQRASKVTPADVKSVVDLWLDMHWKATKIYTSPLKVARRYELTGDARKLYVEMQEAYGQEYWISMQEAMAKTTLHPEEFLAALDSLVFSGFAMRNPNAVKML